MSERFLEGRVATVTGGASGIGRAMALAFASAGAGVAVGSLLSDAADRKVVGELVYLPGREQLESTADEIRSHEVQALAMDLDVTSDKSIDGFFGAVGDELGPVDILANAAGISTEHTISGHPDLLWHKVIDVNLTGTYRCIKRVLSSMIERGWGRIINIASTAASVGVATSGAYCASKAGVVGLTRAVALEGAPHGVTCNSISPTWVNTDFGRDWMTDIAERQQQRSGREYLADAIAANPQGRLIEPDEIGALALFLCRDQALGLTMQDVTVSAGSLW